MSDIDSLSISVLLNVWQGDQPHAIRRAIRSVINQTRQPSELVIVIDGPVEHEKLTVINQEILEALFPCNLVHLDERHGLALARNIGFAVAHGQLVAVHDADDVMHPNRLRLQVESFVRSGSSIVVCQAFEFESRSELIDRLRVTPIEPSVLRVSLMRNNPITHSSVLIRREILEEIGGYIDVTSMEDYHLWLRLLRAGNSVSVMSEVLQAISRDPDYLRRRQGLAFLRSELRILRELNASSRALQRLRNSMAVATRMVLRMIPLRLLRHFYDRLGTRQCVANAFSLDEFTLKQWRWEDDRLLSNYDLQDSLKNENGNRVSRTDRYQK